MASIYKTDFALASALTSPKFRLYCRSVDHSVYPHDKQQRLKTQQEISADRSEIT